MQTVCNYLDNTRADLVSVIDNKDVPENERIERSISVAFRVAGCFFACLTAADVVTRICTFTLTPLPVLGIICGALSTYDFIKIGLNIRNMLSIPEEPRPNEKFLDRCFRRLPLAIQGTLIAEPCYKFGKSFSK